MIYNCELYLKLKRMTVTILPTTRLNRIVSVMTAHATTLKLAAMNTNAIVGTVNMNVTKSDLLQ